MKKPKKKTKDNLKKDVDNIGILGDINCSCRWDMAAKTVDDLMLWIEELCEENHKLKKALEDKDPN